MSKQTPINIHPGEILLEEFLKPMNLSQNKLAMEIRVPVHRVNEIVRGNRSITADTALRLSRFFGTTPGFWLGLQEEFDLRNTEMSMKQELELIRKFEPVAAMA